MAPVIGSGAAISATPTFFMVEDGEFGFVSCLMWSPVLVVSMEADTLCASAAVLCSDFTAEWMGFLSCKASGCGLG